MGTVDTHPLASPPASRSSLESPELPLDLHVGADADASAPQGNRFPRPVGAVRPAALTSCTDGWPAQAELVLSAIEAGQFRGSNRRSAPRRRYRVTASLRLFSDSAQAEARTLYTRDVHARGLGFITPHRLPLGHGGLLELPVGDGTTARIPCTLLRCREAAPGWFEGSLYFNRDQPQLAT